MELEKLIKEYLKKASESYQENKTPEEGWDDKLTSELLDKITEASEKINLRDLILLSEMEVFHIETTKDGTFAYISFQDLNNTDNLNNGYSHIRVPMNLRPIQLSVRGNILVDQSIKNYQDLNETGKVNNN